MPFQTILTSQEDGFAFIQLNRTQALNALNAQMLKELHEALMEIDNDESMRCSIITGSEKAFAAGADIKEMADKSEEQIAKDNQFAPFDEIRKIKKPIIAAVNGFALGGGCELAMACDIIIASETAKFGQPEINLGVIPGMGGTQRLTRAVGKYRAMELMLVGEMFSAEEAFQWGLVNRVVHSEKLLEEAQALAKKIASKPPLAVQALKASIVKSFNASLDDGLTFERQKFNSLFSTRDQKEGMKAFIEKRKAEWKGR